MCVQSISYSLLCRWFTAAVLPLDEALEAALLRRGSRKRCAVCGAFFIPKSNRGKSVSYTHLSQHTGIWYNLESYFANNASAYGNRVSLSMSVTQSNIDTINDIISKNDKWSLTNNCSSFAVKVWNSVSSKTLSAGIPNLSLIHI